MSDFLIGLSKESCGLDLLEMLKTPYGANAPDGEHFALPWGHIAVLRERLVHGRNIATSGDGVCAWVGDLLLGDDEVHSEELAQQMSRLRHQPPTQGDLADSFFARLNGTFAIVSADDAGVSIITDLLNALPVYFAMDAAGHVIGVGTHPDAVACIGEVSSAVDLASAGEFLNRGTPLFPHTIHPNVKEFAPGSLHRLTVTPRQTVEVNSWQYWSPPPESENGCDIERLARELTGVLRATVERRCRGHKVAVKLSGGLDSRVILAGVPSSADCIAVTYCDEINREATVAGKVAQIYRRQWYPLFREKEYIANNFVKAVRLSGCGHEWIHAHGVGLTAGTIRDDVTCVLDGQWSNAFLRLYFAADLTRTNRLGGLLPARYEKAPFDYINDVGGFCTEYLDEAIVGRMRSRRKDFHGRYCDPTRTSAAEWLNNYPLSQEAPLSTLLVERRLIPLRMVFLDREIIEISYRCPLRFKLGNALFALAAKPILGHGRRIPNANDGVRPCSGHVARLAQRAVRKGQDFAAATLEGLGRKPRIEHSWHDYETYWRESEGLAQLAEEYGPNLDWA